MYKIILLAGVVLFASQGFAEISGETAANTVDSFEKLFGVTEGKRRNHTKGFCFAAILSPADKAITEYTNSALFTGPSKVIGRLSHKGGNLQAADDKPGEYGMGLSISPITGETHLMSMNTLDFFPVSTPEAFAELMRAKVEGGAAVKAFKAKNRNLQRFKAHEATKSKTLTPYEGSTFNSINGFYLVNNQGMRSPVRWSFVPAKAQEIVAEPDPTFFFKNIQQNIDRQGVEWNMVITFANADDDVSNAAIPWTGKHNQITAATLRISSVSPEADGNCDDINFDPLVLSKGFEPSEDPLLQARRHSYAISFGKRMSEK